jgi:formiminoglutamate deiminase
VDVDHRWCLIHATHGTDNEIALFAKSGAVAGLCPVTEANLGDGTFEATEFIRHGGRFGIGSDSNVLIGVADELRQLEYSQRLALRARNVMAAVENTSTGRSLFDRALQGGAQALGIAQPGFVQGAFADIVSLDAGHVALAGRTGDALLDSWLFGAGQSLVDSVWARGHKVVTSGRHHGRDAIAARYRRTLEGLLRA